MSILKYSRYSHILFVAMACLLPSLASCTDEDLPDNAAPSLSVQEAANVLRTSVVLNGSITGATNQVKTYGFQYSESENFPADRTTDVPMQDEGLPQGGNVTKQVKDLTPNETYYYRLYASTGATTVYSKSVQFRTANMSSPQIANIVTDSIGERVVRISFDIEDYGNEVLIEVGLGYKKSDSKTFIPVAADELTADDHYTVQITGLDADTQYDFRPYAKNAADKEASTGSIEGYGDIISQKTAALLSADVTTIEVVDDNIGINSVKVAGKVESAKGSDGEISGCGFVWSATVKSPTMEFCDGSLAVKPEYDMLPFTFAADITSLDQSTTYYICAYATNYVDGQERIAYGEVREIETKSLDTPQLEFMTTTDENGYSAYDVEATATTIQVKVNIKNYDSYACAERGVIWSKSTADITLDKAGDNKVVVVTDSRQFTALIENLEIGSSYYVRGYAVYKSGDQQVIGYAKSIECSTSSFTKPTVESVVVNQDKITRNSAEFTGKISSEGNGTITERGFVLSLASKTSNPSLDNCDQTIVSSESFTSVVQGLKPSTEYAVRAYVKSTLAHLEEISYSSRATTFTTSAIVWPEFNNIIVNDEDRTLTSLKVSCGIASLGDGTLQEKGFCWMSTTGKNETPTLENCTGSQAVKDGTNQEFSLTISNLEVSTGYRIRAYVKVKVDEEVTTRYSDEVMQSTHSYNRPSVSDATINYEKITRNSVVLISSVSEGNVPVTERGFVLSLLSKTSEPTLENCEKSVVSDESFISTVTGLSSGTDYAVRAYIKCTIDEKEEVIYSGWYSSFSTRPIQWPSFNSMNVNDEEITLHSLTVSCGLASVGDGTIQEKGFCWNSNNTGTDESPTLDKCLGSKVITDGTNQDFSWTISELAANTSYRIRAYVKVKVDDEVTVCYSSETVRSTLNYNRPSISDVTINSEKVTRNSVELSAKVTEGNVPITERGFVLSKWSKTDNPTLENCDKHVVSDESFISTVTGLAPETDYALRAYVKCSVDDKEEVIYSGWNGGFATRSIQWPSFNNMQVSDEDRTLHSIKVTCGVASVGDGTIQEKGFCWNNYNSGTDENPTLEKCLGSKAVTDGTDQEYSLTIPDLTANTSYRIRAYVKVKVDDEVTVCYSSETWQSTLSYNRPSVSDVSIDYEKVTRNSAVLISSVSEGNVPITERGFVLSLSSKTGNPTLDNCDKIVVSDESFTSTVTGLSSGTSYDVRAYVKYSVDEKEEVSYSSWSSGFATRSIQWPSFNNMQVSDEDRSLHSIKVTCGVASVGDGTIQEKGFCWNSDTGTEESPTLEKCLGSKVVTDGTDQEYSLTIPDLTANTSYRIRAYVKVKVDDEVTVCYSSETRQSTLSYNRPSVSSVSIDNEKVTRNSVELVSSVSEGNVPITERGFVLSLSDVTGDPTLENCAKSVVSDETFTSTVTGLAANTRYSVRAYVKCSVDEKEEVIYSGWSSGFTTRSIQWPSFNNMQVSDEDRTVNSIKVTCGIGSVGDGTLQERGFCWVKDTGMGESPTLEKCTGSQAITEGTDQEFSYTISNLEINTSYRIRAYAKVMVDNQVTVCYSGEAYTSTIDYNSPSLHIGVNDITYTTAKLEGSVEGGNMSVIEKGFVFSKDIYDVKIDNADKVIKTPDAFEASLSDLNYGTRYNVRSYAKCQKGESTVIIYSGTNQFRTTEIDFITFEDFTSNSYVHSLQMSVKLSIESTEGVTLKKCGFCAYYHTGEYREPTINDLKVEMDATVGGVYQLTLDKLMMSSTYLVRPYVVLTIGDKDVVYYHNSTSWCNTAQYSLNLSTSNITETTCDAQVEFYEAYDLTDVEYGFIWSTDRDSDKSTWSKLKCDNLNDKVFSGTITGLVRSTQYYISVYYVVNGKTQYQNGTWEFTTRRLPSQDDNDSPNMN